MVSHGWVPETTSHCENLDLAFRVVSFRLFWSGLVWFGLVPDQTMAENFFVGLLMHNSNINDDLGKD